MKVVSRRQTLKIATAPFIIGADWTFWKGPKDGNGLEGEEESDKASLTLTEVEFISEVDFLTCLKEGESKIIGEEKLARLRNLGCILFGATVFAGLWQDYQSWCQDMAYSVLERLYKQRGITYMDFFGDILRRSSNGRRYVLCLYRDVGGWWHWHYHHLDNAWNEQHFSAVHNKYL